MIAMVQVGRSKSQRGAALAELAVCLPLLTLVMLGVVDFGRAWVQSTAVENAAHAGAQYGSQTTSHAEDYAGIETVVRNDLAVSAVSEGTYDVVPTRYCECADGTPVACTATCMVGGVHMYVQVRVNSQFETLFDYPGIPHTLDVSREVRVRAR
jgi:Flp pilus assembly protein TadG